MIIVKDNSFILHTCNTSYIFHVMETGHLEHLYYGSKLDYVNAVDALIPKHINGNGCTVAYEKHENLCMNEIALEVSGKGTGDFRCPSMELEWKDGSSTVDFVFDSYEVLNDKYMLSALPSSYDETGQTQTLKIVLKEKHRKIKLELYYSLYEQADVITRSMVLRNEGEENVQIKRFMSTQLDIPGTDYVLTSFHGDWIKEMQRYDTPVNGQVVNMTHSGFSSNFANPFVMLFSERSGEDYGEGYAFNLLYSGAHQELAEAGSYGQTRFLAGISPEGFSWNLKKGSFFETPEAVMTYSDCGYQRISRNMHYFIKEHIVRGYWKKKERPILLNSWEASYFSFTEKDLLELAKAGKDVGIELFVLDDGWFGERNDDTSSLGDWEVNLKKLPNGLSGLSEKIKEMGLLFGLWVEPEMISEKSRLYEIHPDWAMKIPGRNHSEGRNQMLLDMGRTEVQDYLIEALGKVFEEAAVDYVKWDMNRNFSDVYSTALSSASQGEVLHRYIIGLYRVMDALTKRFPQILFEGCASGGNRFDLGILSYMPQIWASDNSDAICRCYIQNSYSYGYPQSVIGAHVSACPNHQTLRNTPLQTRFAVAAMGVLGYECNLCKMKEEELEEIRAQIALYKEWRSLLQFGTLYRIGGTLNPYANHMGKYKGNNLVEWNIVSKDGNKAVAVMVQETVRPNEDQVMLRLKGLSEVSDYHFYGGGLGYEEKEDSVINGGLLCHAGVMLSQSFAGTSCKENTRIYSDFASRMYFLHEVRK